MSTPRRLPTLAELQSMQRAQALLEHEPALPDANMKLVHRYGQALAQPRTPLRGDVTLITFPLYVLARSGNAPEAVQRLYDTYGSYRVKPKTNSRGVIWNNQPFWWSRKGYYRPGFTEGPRRPLQHLIWSAHHGQPTPRMHEIFFRDRDRHNFAIDNLELLHKSELHKRTLALGEILQLTPEQRREVAGKRWLRHARRGTSILLASFNDNKNGKENHSGLITSIHDRKAA